MAATHKRLKYIFVNMLEFREIIKVFFSHESPERVVALENFLETAATEYYAGTWKKVMLNDLGTDKVKLNLLRTLYQLQYGFYDGVVNNILQSLDEWSGGTMVFSLMTDEENEFYQHLYAFLAWQNFDHLSVARQLFVLSTRFLVLGLLWDLPVYVGIRRYFAEFCLYDKLTAETSLFAGAIERNETPLTQKGESDQTVKQWLEKFRPLFHKNRNESSVREFIEEATLKENLNKEDVDLLKKLLNLYVAIVTDAIWQKLDATLCIHPHDPTDKNFSEEEYYLDLLEKTDFTAWLSTHEKTADWLKDKTVGYVKKLLAIVKKRANLNDEKQLEYLLPLISEIAAKNNSALEKVLYFDGTDNQFHWNDSLFA